MTSTRVWIAAGATALLVGTSLPGVASAGLFGRRAPARPTPAAATATADFHREVQRAIDEQRLLDAGKMIDQALLAGDKDPQLMLLAGRLAMANGRFADALADYKRVETVPEVKADALEGQGLALSLLGRSDEAVTALKAAVAAKPTAWRAWNALGSEYDQRRRWGEADAAYERAITESDRAPIALNNRGFSRLLQGRSDEAVKDFVEALGKKPDLAEARTNLRLAMAMRGEYDRAVAGAPQDNEAATLNNAGFAAMLRGDYQTAEDLFERAMRARGEYYGRAAANLQLARSLRTQSEAAGKVQAKP